MVSMYESTTSLVYLLPTINLLSRPSLPTKMQDMYQQITQMIVVMRVCTIQNITDKSAMEITIVANYLLRGNF